MINLLFPKVCNACKSLLLEEEILICTTCRHLLSVINNMNFGEQLIKQLFFGKIVIENASVLLKFEKKGNLRIAIPQHTDPLRLLPILYPVAALLASALNSNSKYANLLHLTDLLEGKPN